MGKWVNHVILCDGQSYFISAFSTSVYCITIIIIFVIATRVDV
jgi:hypothetical protein